MVSWARTHFVTIAYLAIVCVSFLVMGRLFHDVVEHRHASCHATLVSLGAIHDNAAAGIRPIVPIPEGLTPQLRKAFMFQAAATRKVNARYAMVIAKVDKAANDLRSSAFCE